MERAARAENGGSGSLGWSKGVAHDNLADLDLGERLVEAFDYAAVPDWRSGGKMRHGLSQMHGEKGGRGIECEGFFSNL
jgi:hypothetical protein